MKQLCISFADLYKLEFIKEGNKLINLKEFVKANSQATNLEILKKNYLDKRIVDNPNVNEDSFWHAIGTLLLNAKLHINGNYDNFGMQYSGMVVVTYVNHSHPCLLEFFVVI